MPKRTTLQTILMDPTGTPEVAQGASRQSSSSTFQLHSQLATGRDLAGDNIRTYSLMPDTKLDVYKMFIFFHDSFFILCYNHDIWKNN